MEIFLCLHYTASEDRPREVVDDVGLLYAENRFSESDRHMVGALDGVPCSRVTDWELVGPGRLSYGRIQAGRLGKGLLSFLQAGGDFGTPQPPQAGKVPAPRLVDFGGID